VREQLSHILRTFPRLSSSNVNAQDGKASAAVTEGENSEKVSEGGEKGEKLNDGTSEVSSILASEYVVDAFSKYLGTPASSFV
jgi:hypothetical protein